MLIVMKADATDAQVAHVCDVISELGFKPHPMPGATRTAIGITGNPGAVDPRISVKRAVAAVLAERDDD